MKMAVESDTDDAEVSIQHNVSQKLTKNLL